MSLSTPIVVYLMPGMAASPSIFDNLNFDVQEFKIITLEWLIPENKTISLCAYAKKMCAFITHPNPVLVGVSFGGILVQEMSKYIQVSHLIIISSIKSKYELPLKMKLAKKTKVYKWIPTHLICKMKWFAKQTVLGKGVKKRLALYEKYLSVNDSKYLKWAIKEMICWQQEKPPKNIVHIHGNKDSVFPIKNIADCVTIENGTHIMILNKAHRIKQKIRQIVLEPLAKEHKKS